MDAWWSVQFDFTGSYARQSVDQLRKPRSGDRSYQDMCVSYFVADPDASCSSADIAGLLWVTLACDLPALCPVDWLSVAIGQANTERPCIAELCDFHQDGIRALSSLDRQLILIGHIAAATIEAAHFLTVEPAFVAVIAAD